MDSLVGGDPERVGPYRLTARLGVGGMGRVYLGESPRGLKVALKVLKPELADRDDFRARFAREVEAARQVGGFHTAEVIDADPRADAPWLATAYIAGPTLYEVIRDHGPMSASATRTLGAGLAQGLAAIHDCGLVHRDLKPGNVIMAQDGPRIIDFGIARAMDSSTLTTTGTLMGTYAYMSPEQIRADSAGPESDVFALGCVLAFVTSGDSPFDAASVPAIVHRILSESPRLDGIPDDLREVIESCLAKEPDDRPHATVIMDRLTGGGSGRLPETKVEAPPGLGRSSFAAAGRISRRAIITGAAVAGTATIAAVAIPAAILWSGSSAEPGSDSNTANKTHDGPPKPSTKPYASLTGHNGQVNAVAFHEDEKWLASCGDDNTVRVWDVDTGKQTKKFIGHTDAVLAVAFDIGTTTLASGGRDRTIRFWALDDEWHDDKGRTGTGSSDSIVSLAPNVSVTVAGLESGKIQLWNYNDVFIADELAGPRAAAVVATGYYHNEGKGSTMVCVSGEAAGKDSLVRVWGLDYHTGKLLHELAGHTGDINAVAFGNDTVASASDDKTVRIWDLSTGKTTTTLKGHTEAVQAVAFNPIDVAVASASRDRTIRIWDTESGKTKTILTEAPEGLNSLAFSPDGKTIAACGNPENPDSPNIQLWRIA